MNFDQHLVRFCRNLIFFSRLIVVCLSSPLVLESSRLVSPRMGRPENTPCWLTPWVSSSSLWLSTRWTPPSLPIARLGSRKSRRKSLASSRRSDTTLLLSHSFPSLAGTETTCCRPAPTCPGTRDGTLSVRKVRPAEPLSSRLSTPSSHQQDLQTSLSGFPSRMFTKLEVLEQCQWAVLRLVSSSLVWLLLLPPTCSPLRLSLLRCTTSPSPRPPPETTLGSTSRTCR